MLMDLATDVLVTLAYGAVGLTLMGIGFVLVDVATPGKLHVLIWAQRNRNASMLLASNLAGVGTIVVVAILTSDSDFSSGIVDAGVYGLLGLLLMSVAFLLLDVMTPGRLGEILVDPEPHPAVWVTAVIHLATGAIIAAAIS